jgi:hypothetical protein
MEESILGVEASASKGNAFYLDKCEHVDHRPPFAACIDKITRRSEGRLESIFSTCSVAISKGECRAKLLRDEELLKGKSIYFVSRAELQTQIAAGDANFGQLTLSVQRPPTTRMSRGSKRVEKTAPAPVSTPSTGSVYADAINSASSPEMVPMLPGETMGEYANRVLAIMKESATA